MPQSASERFARAVEGQALGPGADELRRELAVVGALRRAGGSVELDDVARQRMRRQVLAGFAAAQALPDNAADRRPIRSAAQGVRGRLLVAAAAALCLLMSLSGMSLVLARDALPGDALYGVKRSAESAELGLTFGSASRGFKHLQFATARVDEMEALAARTGGAVPSADAGRYLTALQAFDTDAAAGSRLLVDAATNGDGNLLAALGGWAVQQHQRIDTITSAMPDRAAARTGESLTLLRKIAERVAQVQGRLRCLVVTSGARDDVGLLAADVPCVPTSAGEAGSRTRTPSGAGSPPGTEPSAPTGQTPVQTPGQPPGQQPIEQSPTLPLDPRNTVAAPSSPGSPAQGPPLIPVPNPVEPVESTLAVPLPILPSPLVVPPLVPGLPGVQVG
jgi:hypothetical protein